MQIEKLLNPAAYLLKACTLTAGYSKPCRNEKGGVKSIYFIEVDHKSTMTVVDGEVTTLTLTTGNRAWKYAVEMNTAFFTDTLTGSRENGTLFAAQSLNVILNDNQQATRNQMMLLGQNDVIAIVELANGDFEMLGADNGLTIETDERASGTVKADRSGHTITMVGEEDQLAYKVDSTIIAALLIPAS